MRLTLLITAASIAALSSAAFAQEPAAPAAAAPAAAMAPAPEATAPAAGAPLAAPAGTTPAAVAPPAAQELAPLPTNPLGLTLIDTLEKICKPISNQTGKLDDLAKAGGFVKKRQLWTKEVDKVGTQVVVQPVSVANPTTCTLTINHAKGGFQDLVNGMHAWASRQDPVLQLRAPYAYDDQITKMKRTTVGWEAPSATSTTGMTGMAFTGLAMLNGKDIVRGLDQSELMYQVRK